MPTLNLFTNVPSARIQSYPTTLKRLSQTVASTIGKPERYVMVSISADKPMLYAGTDEPCAWAEVISIGGLGAEQNKKISAGLAEIVAADLEVPKDRFYIKFSDVERSFQGYNGSTF